VYFRVVRRHANGMAISGFSPNEKPLLPSKQNREMIITLLRPHAWSAKILQYNSRSDVFSYRLDLLMSTTSSIFSEPFLVPRLPCRSARPHDTPNSYKNQLGLIEKRACLRFRENLSPHGRASRPTLFHMLY
jgi:hypothetical protein